MRFKIGKTSEERWNSLTEKFKQLNEWRPWFAWRPVRVDDNRWAFWETVERRIEHIVFVRIRLWSYRFPNDA